MKKNLKFNANELLDSFNRELNLSEINEIYKAILAYSVGLKEISQDQEDILNDIIENTYFEDDSIRSFINDTIYEDTINRLA